MPRTTSVTPPVPDPARATVPHEAVGACEELLSHDNFRGFTPEPIADAARADEALFRVSAGGREEAGAIVGGAGAAGGRAAEGSAA